MNAERKVDILNTVVGAQKQRYKEEERQGK